MPQHGTDPPQLAWHGCATHWPPVQYVPGSHFFPHIPQFVGSFWRFAHCPAQQSRAVRHAGLQELPPPAPAAPPVPEAPPPLAPEAPPVPAAPPAPEAPPPPVSEAASDGLGVFVLPPHAVTNRVTRAAVSFVLMELNLPAS
jgi:hypothetical protein